MPAPWGLISTGFNLKPIDAILTDIQTAQLAGISPALNLFPPDPLAVVTGIIAAGFEELWQLAAALYSGMDPDSATGDQLAGLALLTGTLRLDATRTIVSCTVNVNAGFAAGIGTMFASIAGVPSLVFDNVEAVNSPGGGDVTVEFHAQDTGPIACNAGTLTTIAVALAGWNTITNAAAGTLGSDIQTDAALRLEREAELTASGDGTASAIRARILRELQPANSPLSIDGIASNTTNSPFALTASTVSCTVLYNDTDAVDANGLPAHSLEAIAYAPGNTANDDRALCALILATKAAGISTYSGTPTSKVITDDQGNDETVYYTRPSSLVIYIAITVKAASGATVTAADVKAALVNYATAAWTPGGKVYALKTETAAFAVPGVVDVTAFTIDTVTPPVAVLNITPTIRQIPTLTTGHVTVTVT